MKTSPTRQSPSPSRPKKMAVRTPCTVYDECSTILDRVITDPAAHLSDLPAVLDILSEIIMPRLESALSSLLSAYPNPINILETAADPNHHLLTGTVRDIQWYCIPLSPFAGLSEEIKAIVLAFYDLVRVILDIFIFRGFLDDAYTKRKGFQETVATLVSTVYILEYTIGKDPNQGRFRVYPSIPFLSQKAISGSLFHTIYPKSTKHTDLFRPNCVGYLLLARRQDHHLMSMTVWARQLTDSHRTTILDAQEHALIVKNPLLPDGLNVRNLAIKMHSFAADAVRQEIVTCTPYTVMSNILLKNIEQGRIKRVPRRYHEVTRECAAFSSFFQVMNDAKLKSLWKSATKIKCDRERPCVIVSEEDTIV